MRRQLFALVGKDLRVTLSDRRAVVVLFAVPAVLALFMGFVFGGRSTSGAPRIETAVVDEDGSEVSRRLAAALAEDPVLAAEAAARPDAEDRLRRGKLEVAIVIPAGFGAAARAAGEGRKPPEIVLLHDPTASIEVSIAQGVLAARVARAVADDPAEREALARCAGVTMPFAPRVQAVTSSQTAGYDGAAHSLAGMGVQFILIGAVDAAVGMLTERQRGLLRRLRTAPLSRATLIASRLLSGAVISALVIVFLALFGRLTMGVSLHGSPLGFVVLAASFALMASALGVLISTLGKTPQATRGLGIFVILVAVMLGGAWFPAFLFPDWLRTATLFVPTRWAVDGFDAMTWRGLGFDAALPGAAVLLGFAALFAGLAVLRFRWDDA